jgi:hypothetical protein
MHSQQTFNECIAQAEGVLAGREPPRTGWALEKREQRLRPHVLTFSIEWLGFNVLPSSGLAGGTAEHRSASSSEAPRRL